MTDILTEIGAEIKVLETDVTNFFTGTVEPDAEKAAAAVVAVGKAWLAQFETDFGAKALALAIAAVGSITAASPIATVISIGATVAEQIGQAAETIAEQDAQTIILNAARTALTAASIPAAAPATPAAAS